jgi:glycosyltransferase involved in cell wall biosynthesis
MQPLISVIVPVYRVEAYLTACVESVLAQTYHNFELILVDDGSPDKCPGMCDDFAARDSRIRVIHKENGGLSSARNAGIDAAKGDYLAFLDSDDLWTPVFLERLYRSIEETGAELAVCLFRRFRGEAPTDLPQTVPTETLTRRQAFECLFGLRNENMVVAPNKLYHRRLFDGIRYPVGKLHEDEAVIHEVIGAAKTVAWVDEAHYLYRESPDSITTAKFSLRRLDETYAKEQRIAWFEAHNMPDLADRTRIVYLNNLMRLYRTVQAQVEDRTAAKEACRKLHKKFFERYRSDLLSGQGIKFRVRCFLFRNLPAVYSWFEYQCLKRKEIT